VIMVPHWLHLLSILFLLLGFATAVVLIIEEVRHPQHMWIMNIVWPVVALFGTALTIRAYFRYGRLTIMDAAKKAKSGGEPPDRIKTPFPLMVGKSTLDCGSGCALGDIGAEWLAFAFPMIAVLCGWHWLLREKLFAVWVLDFIFAFVIGIAFQYFTIVPMRHLEMAAEIGCGAEGGCSIAERVADRHVWFHGLRESVCLPAHPRRQSRDPASSSGS